MKQVQESLYSFEDNKFFSSLNEAEEIIEKEEKLTPEEKKKLSIEKQKQGMAVIKKLQANWKRFKSIAGDKTQSYGDFWAEQKNANNSIGQQGMFYNLYDSNYIVGVVKNAEGKAELKVYNMDDKEDDFETFVCSDKEVMKAFTNFFKGEVEGTMKQVIASHKAAVEAKKQQILLKKKEQSAAAKKAKLDAFLGESKKK